jgi:hypothetical protein
MEMLAFPDIKKHGNGQIGKKGCSQKKGMWGKLADIDVSAQHSADMLLTFPTKSLANHGNQRKNAKQIDYNYNVGDKVLVINKGILRKAEFANGKESWTITTVHTNGTIRIQQGTKRERLRIRRVEPYTDDIL